MGTKLDAIRDRAIDLVAEAINDEDIPAAKRADMALSLLGKQAIKEPSNDVDDTPGDIEIVFRVVGEDGSDIERIQYRTQAIPVASQGDAR